MRPRTGALLRCLPLLGMAGLFSACVIIIKPSGDMPVPVPIPLTCVVGGGGIPTAHLILNTRIERGTVNMIPQYEEFMTKTGLALAGAGIQPTVAVMVRADERPVDQPVIAAWGCNLDSPDTLKPGEVIRFYAENRPLPQAPLGCVTDPVTRMGQKTSEVVTQYPLGLNGQSGLGVFSSAPDVVLVVHMDHLARRTGWDEPGCASAQGMALVGDDGTAPWLQYVGSDVPAERIVHWFVNTEEGVDEATFYQNCRKAEGVPTNAFDNLQPSPKLLYSPLARAVEAAGSPVTVKSICEMLAAPGDEDFFVEQMQVIGDLVGVPVDPQRVKDVVNGGIPAILNQNQGEPSNFGEGALDNPPAR